MFESLNFQLTAPIAALESTVDRPDTGALRQSATEAAWPPFSSLLGIRTDTAVAEKDTGGEILPESGKPLPPFDLLGGVDSLPGSGSEADLAAVKRQELDRDMEPEVVKLPLEIPTSVSVPVKGQELEWRSDLDRNPELEVVSLQPELPITVTVPAVWPPSQNFATILPLEAAAEARSSRDRGATLEARSLPLRETQAGVDMTTQNPVVPTTKEPAAWSNLAVSIRELQIRTSPPTTMVNSSPTDSEIELADLPRENAAGLLARTLDAQTSVRRSDTNVIGTTSLHSGTPVYLPAAISQSGNEPTLYRAPALIESISTPVRDPAWAEVLGERVLVLTERQMKSAEIRLTPADLGPLRVRISVEEGATHVTFHVQHAVTREAIEQALPRLREMLADSGLSLGQTDVSEQDVAGGSPDREPVPPAVITDEPADEPPESGAVERRNIVTASNLLDTFV